MSVEVDYLVIGSGLAGLTYALTMAPYGSVAVLTKKNRDDANSSWAQGGVAGVLSEEDSFELHKQDTLTAGAELCHEDAVDVLVHEGPERIRDLMRLGAHFDTRTDGEGNEILSLGREGGHSRNRIVHTADYTGWECERTLLEALKAHPEILVYEHFFVTDLLIQDSEQGRLCTGAAAINRETGELTRFKAKAVLLATGGSGQVYQHTTNPEVATGDGVAIAYRAGATIANMEFVQFHPTTLYHEKARAFLITEALRGEGGILRHADGEAFMSRYHKDGELAPRDIVARAIVSELKRKEVPCVYLDATHLDPEMLKTHFPTVYERCLSVDIDITRRPIPIVPAQHYQCGGVVTDLEGKTDIARLYAAGEVACTGVHGANRLASNSLLEAMVYGYRAALHSRELPLPPPVTSEKASAASPSSVQRDHVSEGQSATIKQQARKTMQRLVGIVRTTQELLRAEQELLTYRSCLAQSSPVTVEDWETSNIVQVGLLIVRSALLRKESRGLHFTLDYPERVETEQHDTLLVQED